MRTSVPARHLQLQRDVLRHVAHPGAVGEAVKKPPRRPSEQACSSIVGSSAIERLVEARDGVRGVLLEHAQVHRASG